MKFGEIIGKPGPVQLDCKPQMDDFFDEPWFDECKWQVEPDVIQAVLDCSFLRERAVLSRNMDDMKHKYPWRVSQYDKRGEEWEPFGHFYGKSPEDALSRYSPHDKCELVSVRRRTKKPESLSALPKKGRIPLKTVQSALNRLGKKAKACKITASALREGMEVEREHRDVTKGGVLKTAKIAAAHICERPDYYKRLKRFVEK